MFYAPRGNAARRTGRARAWQCFFFSRNVGSVAPKIIYFHSLIKYYPDQSIQKTMLILNKEALVRGLFGRGGRLVSSQSLALYDPVSITGN